MRVLYPVELEFGEKNEDQEKIPHTKTQTQPAISIGLAIIQRMIS